MYQNVGQALYQYSTAALVYGNLGLKASLKQSCNNRWYRYSTFLIFTIFLYAFVAILGLSCIFVQNNASNEWGKYYECSIFKAQSVVCKIIKNEHDQ